MSVHDAVIIGAGPAGSMAAHRLSRAGLRTALINDEPPGRRRVCGGFMGPEAGEVMAAAGLEMDFAAFDKYPIDRVLISSVSGRHLETGLPKQGWAVDRGRFDEWLAGRAVDAGAQLMAPARVTRMRRISGLWQLTVRRAEGEQELNTRHLIIASGRRRPHGRQARDNRVYFACKTAYEGLSGMAGRVALHFVRHGHVGLNPLDVSRATMCLYIEQSCIREHHGDLDAMMAALMRENTCLADALKTARRAAEWHSCQAQPDDKKVFFQKDQFHVGDAVTMVHPIVGGGIPVAMRSGMLLADAIADAPDRPAQRIADDYRRRWVKAFSCKVRFAAWLGRAERSALATEAVFTAMTGVPALLDAFVRFSRRGVTDRAA